MAGNATIRAKVTEVGLRRAGLLVFALAMLLLVCTRNQDGPSGVSAAAGPKGQLVYLDFVEGTEGTSQGSEDDATRNVSRLCALASSVRWEPAPQCGGRDRCKADVLRLVREYFKPYNVGFTLSRPSPPQVFTTIVIAPPVAMCTYGRRGVVFADCGNKNPSDMAFVFDCYGDAASCAILVAHETGHTFGLVHSLDPSDIMTLAPEERTLRFREQWSPTIENKCGILRQSSHEALLSAVGPRPPSLP
jgi:hypothetical protein